MNLLKVEKLNVETTLGKKIINDISFELSSGETVVLLGQSGCGKSVTSMAVQGLLPAGLIKTGGEVSICGKPFEPYMRGGYISMIMQAPATCFDQLFNMRSQFSDILSSNGKDSLCNDAYFCKIISEVELDTPMEILDSYPFQLSGGMLQRLMIALTLALGTKVIIADEPTSDLDISGQAEILKLIKRIRPKDSALLLITHDLSVAENMADRVLVMNNAELVDSFKVNELHDENRNSYTKSLVTSNRGLYQNDWDIDLEGCNAEM
ncbi:ABC transporter related protein [Denitrovibrio acetiphilus DSM 12809]|uniref:ABC transporter related protein n=1 Tax=Denitrovibrio acetiphilus (strain DSM 12809 / NBRC 114555 / N2460) TaxID=522772 RepID=D4H8J1_DENA2|nr:ABC transporter ATP-binding protein [Denitrovibrio acetiphilus]ADD68340.1 ABC transporter related protein [Denitrovibrio acetiphilus DSM 12809]